MADMAERAGGEVTKIERPWGEVFTVAEVKEALAKSKPKIVAIVMAETSTGAWQPIEEIAAAVHDAGAMLILDTVTALGGIPVEIDKWQVDAVYSGTQKCLGCPPGLAPVSFSKRAVEKILARKEKPRSWYLDVSLIANYWGGDRVYHHTAPINMTYALHEALRILLEEGLEDMLRAAPQESRSAQGRPGRDRHRLRRARRPRACRSSMPCESQRRRRCGRPQRLARAIRHRNRRRPRRIQRQSLANRPDGLQQPAGERAAVARRP